MHAGDVVETLPTALPDDDVLSAVRMVVQHGLPGLVVADERGHVVGCMSSINLLHVVLPEYFFDGPCLAQVIDESHADRIAAELVGKRVRDVLERVTEPIPHVRADATVVELGAIMGRRHSPFALIERDGGGILGIVTANRLLGLLAAAVADTSS
ncbi:CBS domain-containing protein [Streptomyces sp. NPDC002851]